MSYLPRILPDASKMTVKCDARSTIRSESIPLPIEGRENSLIKPIRLRRGAGVNMASVAPTKGHAPSCAAGNMLVLFQDYCAPEAC